MIAACGWADGEGDLPPLYDPAAAVAPSPSKPRRWFATSRRAPASLCVREISAVSKPMWAGIQQEAAAAVRMPPAGTEPLVFGSDVSHRMVDFAQRNAERAGLLAWWSFAAAMPCSACHPARAPACCCSTSVQRTHCRGRRGWFQPAWCALCAPKRRPRARRGAGRRRRGQRILQPSGHPLEKNFPGWTAWVLTPDFKLPGKMRLKESRRVPLWNGPIECRMFRFVMTPFLHRRHHDIRCRPRHQHRARLLGVRRPRHSALRCALHGGNLRWLATLPMRTELARVLGYPRSHRAWPTMDARPRPSWSVLIRWRSCAMSRPRPLRPAKTRTTRALGPGCRPPRRGCSARTMRCFVCENAC